jgi:lysophospholipase L1-like esterase
VTNRGVGGEDTSAVLARFDRDVIAARPDAVIIWGHINDIFRAPGGDMQAATRSAKDSLREMIERARAAGIEPIVATEVTLSRLPGLREWAAGVVGRLLGKKSYQERVNDQVREVNHFLRGLASQMDLRLLDFEQAVDDGSGYRRAEFSAPDGSHISQAGYDHLTAYTRSVFSELNAGG